MKHKKISLKEKLRRSNQGQDKTRYLDGSGGTFLMTKCKDGFKLETSK